jgi:hypothetical protein
MMGGFFLYLIPCLGYLLFTPVPLYDSVFNYVDPGLSYVIVMKVALVISAVFSGAYYLHFVAKVVVAEIIPQAEAHGLPTWVAGLTIGCFAISINFMTQALRSLMYAIAYVASCLLEMVLPGVFFLGRYRFTNVKWGAMAAAVLLFGLGLISMSIAGRVQTGL